jgi:hypothetical protein
MMRLIFEPQTYLFPLDLLIFRLKPTYDLDSTMLVEHTPADNYLGQSAAGGATAGIPEYEVVHTWEPAQTAKTGSMPGAV